MYAYYESMSGNPVFFHYTFLFSKVFLSGGKIGNGPDGHNIGFLLYQCILYNGICLSRLGIIPIMPDPVLIPVLGRRQPFLLYENFRKIITILESAGKTDP